MANAPQAGRGLLRPLRRGPSDYESGTGETLLSSNAAHVISTRAAGFNGRLAGEYPWRKNFGSWIHLLRHSNATGLRGDIGIVYLTIALAKWEPRVDVFQDQSEAVKDPQTSRLQRIRVYFRPSGQPSPNVRRTLPSTYQEVTL